MRRSAESSNMLSTSFALVPAAIPRRRSALLPLPLGAILASSGSHVLPPLPSCAAGTPQRVFCRRVGLIWKGLAAKRKAGVRQPSPAATIADIRIKNSTLPVCAWHPAGAACTIRGRKALKFCKPLEFCDGPFRTKRLQGQGAKRSALTGFPKD